MHASQIICYALFLSMSCTFSPFPVSISLFPHSSLFCFSIGATKLWNTFCRYILHRHYVYRPLNKSNLKKRAIDCSPAMINIHRSTWACLILDYSECNTDTDNNRILHTRHVRMLHALQFVAQPVDMCMKISCTFSNTYTQSVLGDCNSIVDKLSDGNDGCITICAKKN